MDEFFPLCFKKTEDKIYRGLSANEADDKSELECNCHDPSTIPERDKKHILTLVWDLDQTLVSADGVDKEDEYDGDTKLVIRPHAKEVLKILKRNEDVEFIVWTAGSRCHAKRVVYSFPEISFDHVIYRNDTWYDCEDPTKNLNLISTKSRPLSTIILIDDRMDIGREHPENLLVVPPYYPKERHVSSDRTLLYLANIIQRAINQYRKNNNNSFCSYLFSPLSEKCIYEGMHYYGVKCFQNQDELKSRIRDFTIKHGKI